MYLNTHKKPFKFRYITSTTCAVGKPLAKIMKGCFATIQKEVIRACKMKDYYIIEKMVLRRVGLLTIILKFRSNFSNLTELFLKLIQFTHLILIPCTQVFLTTS